MQSTTNNIFGNEAENESVADGAEDSVVGQDSIIAQEVNGRGCNNDKKAPSKRGNKRVIVEGIRSSSDNVIKNQNGNILREVSEKVVDQLHGKNYSIYNGDSCEVIKGIPDNSIHFQIMSPPFADLFVYSNSERDIGNCKSDEEFFEHYQYLVREQLRVAMPGRLCAIHVMQLPTSKVRHGMIGLRDFRGACIREFVKAGWIYHSEVCIWKNPVTAMQRTKALGLLHKQLKKDSCMSRQGVADYLVVFRKPGDNPERVEHTGDSFPVAVWQRYASPVWASVESTISDSGFMEFRDALASDEDKAEDEGIMQGRTLQRESAREDKDEKHLCCLQLGVIRRALRMWTNPNDIVASWFMGIGSEGFVSIEQDRRFIGCELKKSYYAQSKANMAIAQSKAAELTLFS